MIRRVRKFENANEFDDVKQELEIKAKDLSILSKLVLASLKSAMDNCSYDSGSKFNRAVESFESYKDSMYDLLDELNDGVKSLKGVRPRNYIV